MFAIYFGFSSFYLIFRTFFVLYMAALINDSSKAQLRHVHKIPSLGWCQETQRFAEQLSYDCVALTGNNFFFMTRSLVLAVRFS